ncbi:DoxX family protein [Robertkochia sediminum]|uniref:DoxX family protein n=1 Tax=Robertkochia sediminum TaxID=2785326 RepID=UPI0019326E25|nr:DoxX family protein [Robertkochia sediminum]MBL7473103.1 DoxX family protein [Robertkochia sediminum]
MHYFIIFLKVFLFISIINVWFFQFGKSTRWRGGDAISMPDEFSVYGLSENTMMAVGGLKVLFATLLIASIWFPFLAIPAASGMALLMLGAIGMHMKIGDPLIRSFPAFSFFLFCAVIILNKL